MAILQLVSDLFSPAPGVSGNDPRNRANAHLRALRWQVGPTLEAGDIGTTIAICTLPQYARYCSQLSKLGWKGFGVGRTVNLGWAAYTLASGIVVPASPGGLGTGLSVAADGRSFHDAFPTSSVDEWEAPVPVVLTLTVLGGTIPMSTTMGGLVVYLASH